MKLYFMKQKALNYFKVNMGRLYVNYFQKSDNTWMTDEFGENPFNYFIDVPDFELTSLTDDKTIGEIDFLNCKIIYENLKAFSESQASSERLWAGLCNGTFYNYLRKRYGYDNVGLKDRDKDCSGVVSRFFFSGGTRGGFYRNAIAKCWWVGRATYDKTNITNHFEMLDALGANDLTTKISDIFYSNTFASNPVILRGICDALKFYNDRGIKLRMKEEIRPALQYLNAVGGATLLDVLTSEEIKNLIVKRISELLKGITNGIDIPVSDEDELENEIDEVAITSVDENEELESNDTQDDQNFDNIDFDDNGDENNGGVLEKPEFVTWGCYIKIKMEKNNKVLTYHIPLVSDTSRNLWGIEKRMLGKQVGHRIYHAGSWYELFEIGWEEDYNK